MTPTAPPQSLPFWLRGAFAPVSDEVTAFDLPVRGELPHALSGTYLRNGPNPKTGFSPHWWFGDGMVHGVSLAGGRARWYRNRYLRTPAFMGAFKPEHETEEQGRERRRRSGGSSNTNVIEHGGRRLSLVETSLPLEINAEMDTLGVFDFGGRVDTPVTAHPKLCPRTGELHFFGYQHARPFVTYYIADAAGHVQSRREIEVEGPSLMHDFAITDGHALFFDGSARMVKDWGQGFPFDWDAAHQARIGVVARAGGAVRWFEVAAGHLGHTVNAFECAGKITLEGIHYAGLGAEPPLLHRWVLDLASGLAHEAQLDERAVEFPRIDERRLGGPHRYSYLVEPRDVVDGLPASALLRRYDATTGTSQAYDLGKRQLPAECVFVPARGDAPEDEGWLLTFVYDGERNGSDLVVLDARAFDGPPLARISLPQRVPIGFHGSWLPQR